MDKSGYGNRQVFHQLTMLNQLLKLINIVRRTRTRLLKIKDLIHKVSSIKRREVLFSQSILHNCPLGDGWLLHTLKVSGECLPRLPNGTHKFHFSKANTLNIRHPIPSEIVLHGDQPV